MSEGLPWFVKDYEKNDAEFYSVIKAMAETSTNTRALDPKTRYLILMALDVLKGAPEGVKVLAKQARAAGASEEEIKETVRLAYYVSGMDVIKTALNAF
ncbi:MAG: carboxymuconolactone decarboxylase family protein [Syntrophomonadaceae bacterium]|jgi:alkylhydroperoxidase/carboxymuconolactone decarboxylase family protein YurZ